MGDIVDRRCGENIWHGAYLERGVVFRLYTHINVGKPVFTYGNAIVDMLEAWSENDAHGG